MTNMACKNPGRLREWVPSRLVIPHMTHSSTGYKKDLDKFLINMNIFSKLFGTGGLYLI